MLELDLPRIPLNKINFNTKANSILTYPSWNIFIYRGEESDDTKKEICTVFQLFKNNSTTLYDKDQQTLVTITCYQYGSWKVTRGPRFIVFDGQNNNMSFY